MKQWLILAATACALTACQNSEQSAPPSAQPEASSAPPPAATTAPSAAATTPTAVTLLDGTSIDGWNQVGDANWHVVDGYVEADSGQGFLVTPGAYSDFHLLVEFWADDPANSGVFIRCANPAELSATTCYEVNVFDRRPDQTYRTGGIVNVAAPMAKVDAAGHWNTYDITAQGSHLIVRLNDTLTVDVEDDKHASGPIGLQYSPGVDGAGVLRFRKVQLTPL